jgi:hypothetical protein
MKERIRIASIVTLTALVILLGGWEVTYPSAGDPKNLRYVLWKAGLYKMDLDLARGTMVGDPSRDKLVNGKTEAALRGRFGYLLTPLDASPYLKVCSAPWKERKVLFIRNSPWMVVFNGDKATDLVLIKGC